MSFVWKHFKRETGNKDARCDVDSGNRKCSAVLNCAGGSTKGLTEHLKRVRQILDPLKSGPTTSNQAQPSTSSTANPPVKRQKLMTDFNRASFEETISKEAALNGLNFEQIIDSDKIEHVKETFPTKNFPMNRSGVAKIVRGFHEDIKAKIKSWIQTHLAKGHFFSTTLDEWTSTAVRHFLNINLHYFENGVDKEINFGMVPIYGSVIALNIEKLFEARLMEFGLDPEKYIVGTSGDGASAMVSFWFYYCIRIRPVQ
ncbi:uncharacterized protein LOC136087644 [Hydra vulgaris]|uniref:Uncharacterized protein LOC136087644 n=1 Tax=Hydra vulgaris TaxID=6087 RepID=A0ABM4CYU7_HYDVU